MICAVDAALALPDDNHDQENSMSQVDMKTLFAGFDPARYQVEARERWGHTEAYRVSRQCAERYTNRTGRA